MNDLRLDELRVEAGELARRIDTIETAYELMLAYAGQGWRADDQGSGVRVNLVQASRALDGLGAAVERALAGRVAGDVARRFSAVIAADSERASAAIELALAHPSMSSQLVENLNASTHLRAVLSGLLLIDEWVDPEDAAG
jgi:hypothetical protein